MKIAEVYKGTVILDIGVRGGDEEEFEPIYVNNTNLVEWYPVDKGLEYVYYKGKVMLEPNAGSNSENHPVSVTESQEVNRDDLEYGTIEEIEVANRRVIDAAMELYGLEDPEEFTSRADVEDAISHAFLVLHKYEHEADMIKFYERNELVEERKLNEIAKDLELVGKLVQFYLLYRKVM